MKITESKNYIDWQESEVKFSKVPHTWNEIDVPWIEVIQTKEVIQSDPWDIYTTRLKNELSELHQSWNIPDESVLHYMSIRPELKNGLEFILDDYKDYTHNYNLLKLTAGHMIVWHFDTYATFVKHNNIAESDSHKIKRSVIMLTPWSFGHVLQIGKKVISDWNAGDVYTWNNDTWHGACNFGKKDFIVMQVTYIE